MNISDTGYISLKEATKYCDYSRDYLKLRSRQGKLKAVKIGRNWVTTKEWLEDYLVKIAQFQSTKLTHINLTSVKPNNKLARRVFLIFLIFDLILITGGIFTSLLLYDAEFGSQLKYSVNTFKAYFQWVENQAVSIEFEKILPARVIEIKMVDIL